MNRNELDAFLGDFADTLTDEQADEILAAAEYLDQAYTGDDYANEREAMLSGIVQATLGDDDLASMIRAWHAAKAAYDTALATMRGGIAVEVGRTSENAVHTTYGLARPTVRKALGK